MERLREGSSTAAACPIRSEQQIESTTEESAGCHNSSNNNRMGTILPADCQERKPLREKPSRFGEWRKLEEIPICLRMAERQSGEFPCRTSMQRS